MIGKPPITVRLRTHADNMQFEGWYTTANVLDEAATEIEHLLTENTRLRLAFDWAIRCKQRHFHFRTKEQGLKWKNQSDI